MDQPTTTACETLTVLYDGGCPLCRREIAHVQGLAKEGSALCFVDISTTSDTRPATDRFASDRQALLARFHVQREDGSRLSGAAAFVAMWARLPGWRWAARLAQLPGALTLLEAAYRGFLLMRPALQAIARRSDTRNAAAALAGGPLSWMLRAWCTMVSAGSAAAAWLARRV